jgi:cytochrome c
MYKNIVRLVITTGMTLSSISAQAYINSAEALLLTNKCAKCHSVDKQKDGPSYKSTALKYKDTKDADKKLYTHLTTGPKVKIDGIEEEHVKIKGEDAAIKDVVKYILSR